MDGRPNPGQTSLPTLQAVGATGTEEVPTPTAVTVSPAVTTADSYGTVAYTATVTGTGTPTLAWSDGGAGGIFTPPFGATTSYRAPNGPASVTIKCTPSSGTAGIAALQVAASFYFDLNFATANLTPGYYSSVSDAHGNTFSVVRALGYNSTPSYVKLGNGTLRVCPANTVRVEQNGFLIDVSNQYWYDCLNLNSFFTFTGCSAADHTAQSPVEGTDITASVVTLSGTSAHYVRFNFSQAASYVGAWICTFAKYTAGGPKWITISESTSFAKWATFDIEHGLVGNSSADIDGCFGRIEAYGNGFYRCMAFIPGIITPLTDVKGVIAFADSQVDATPVAGVLPSWTGSGTVTIWGSTWEVNNPGGTGLLLYPGRPAISNGFAPANAGGDYFTFTIPAAFASDINDQAAYSGLCTARSVSDNQYSTFRTSMSWGAFNANDSIYCRGTFSSVNMAVYNHTGGHSLVTTGGLGESAASNLGPGYHSLTGFSGADGSAAVYSDGIFIPLQSGGAPGVNKVSVAPATLNTIDSFGQGTWLTRWNAGPNHNAVLDGSSSTDAGTGFRVAVLGDNNSNASGTYVPWPMLLQARTWTTTPRAYYDFAHEAGVSDNAAVIWSTWIAGKGFTHLTSQLGMVNVLFSDQVESWITSNTAATIWADIQALWDNARAAGITVYPQTLFGAGQSALWTSAKTTMLNAINASITAYASLHGLTLLDLYTLMTDPGSPPNVNPLYLNGPTDDNINSLGHMTIANYIKTTLGI